MQGTARDDATRSSAAALIAAVGRIRERGWCDGTSGNYSVTLDRDPLRLLITPSGADKGNLAPNDLLVVDENACAIDGSAAKPSNAKQSNTKPSAETHLHVTLARLLAPGSILHTHSVWGTLLGEAFVEKGGFRIGGYEMLKGIDGVRSHRDEVFVPVVENSQDMAVIAERIDLWTREHPEMRGFLIAGHGLYTWGRDIAEASRHVEIFEFLFQLVGRRTPFARFDG